MIREKVVSLIKEHQEEIRKFNVRTLSIFGSVARNQETPQSDIDILIDFDGPSSFDLYMELKFF